MEGGGRRAFKIYGATQLNAEQAQHHRENHGRMLHAARKPPEHPDTGHGDDDDGHGLDEVCEKARVFKRMRGVWPEKAAAVGAQLLNRHKSRYRATGNNLLGPLQGLGDHGAVKRHDHAAQHQHAGRDQAEGQQHQKGGPHHVGVKIAHQHLAGQAARQGRQAGQTRGRSQVLQKHQGELSDITERLFAGIVLQIGVGGEGSRGVEDQAALQSALAVGIERQPLLRAQHQVNERKNQGVEQQHRQSILLPILLPSDNIAAALHKQVFDGTPEAAIRNRIAHGPGRHLADGPGHDDAERHQQKHIQHGRLLLQFFRIQNDPDEIGNAEQQCQPRNIQHDALHFLLTIWHRPGSAGPYRRRRSAPALNR